MLNPDLDPYVRPHLGQSDFPSAHDTAESLKEPKAPGRLRRIGSNRFVAPIARGVAAVMLLGATAYVHLNGGSADSQSQQTASIAHAAENPNKVVLLESAHKGPVESFRNLHRGALQKPDQRSALQTLNYQSITRMDAPTWTQRCAGRATTYSTDYPSVPMNDVLVLGRMSVFSDRPEYEQEALNNDYHQMMDAYTSSIADFWRHFYGIQTSSRTQVDFVRPGNFWGPNGEWIYPNIDSLGDRLLQVAPVRADRPGQYVVPVDIFLVDATYPVGRGRPRGPHGQVIYDQRPLLNGLNEEDLARLLHELGHSLGDSHQNRNPRNVMHADALTLPLEVDIDTVNENCPPGPADGEATRTPTATAAPTKVSNPPPTQVPGTIRQFAPIGPRNSGTGN